MSYNGSGTFNINTTGQPVVAGTVISSSAFNSLTSDLATGLSTAITKDGQTTTTARITFAQGITSSLVTDSSSVSTGSIITDGGMGVAKNLYVGGTLNVTGSTSLTNPVINNIKMGYTTTATAGGSTSLTVSSNYRQFFTGTLAQTIVLPVTSTLVTGMAYEIENNSTGLLTVNSSGGNLVGTIPAGVCAHAVCIGTTLTTAADWDWDYISTTTITGTGANVLGTSPTITTPTISSLSSAASTALTLQSAGTTAVTIDTSQNVGIGTTSPDIFSRSFAKTLGIDGSSGAANTGIQINGNTSYNAEIDFGVGGTRQATVQVSNTYFAVTANTSIPILFSTNNSERMRINAGAPILCLAGGSTTATGTGIAFPATQSASSNANTLDDYEEGTWTPGFAPASGSITYTSVGTYVKVGKAVTVYWSVTITGGTVPSGAGTVSNFPFTTNDSGGAGANRAAIGLVREDAATGVAYFFYLNASATSGIVNTLTNGGLVWTNGYTYDGMVTYIASA